MEEIGKFISTIGFPAAITVYLLYRFEKKIVDLTQEITKLKDAIVGKDGILDKIEELKYIIDMYKTKKKK